MSTVRRGDLIAALLVALLAAILFAAPPLDRLRGLSIDVLTWLRWQVFGALHDPVASPVVVVALDEETFNTQPFSRTPTVTWTRELARVLTAVIDGGAIVVGFDVIFPNSIEQSEIPFGEETLGARVRGFDREFLRALASAARAGKLVLGEVQHQEYPIRPSEGQRIAVGHLRNIRALNFYSDPDDVVRRVPVNFSVDGQPVPSMPVELAARALGSALPTDWHQRLAGIEAGARIPNTFTLNFEGGSQAIPTYSLADLRACAEKGETAFFRKHFGGRVVLIGTVLDVEDRKVASNRLTTEIEVSRAERCALPRPAATGKFARDSISGVYIVATAVNNLIRGDVLSEPGRLTSGLAIFALAAASCVVALTLSSGLAAVVLAGLLITWTGGATWSIGHSFVLPLVDALAAALLAFTTMTGYRAVVVERDKRLLRRSFALYLPPAVIDTMLASSKPPTLGGETRNVTVFFSDLAGFSTLAERLNPTELVSLMNAYLSAMTEIIEGHGGFIDKYIGDAIVAVFGAPVDRPDHALSAVRAALACKARLAEMNRSGLAVFKGSSLGQRIGLNSGPVLIGNIGSRQRFNYTAMGDTVNIASRLEGANKAYGTEIIASRYTRDQAGSAIFWRELDLIRVVGIARPVEIFEPLAERGAETELQKRAADNYKEGLRLWRARNFAGSAAAFLANAGVDPPSSSFGARASQLTANPPGDDWEPVNNLDAK
jgi:class 3 adenylate cyclase